MTLDQYIKAGRKSAEQIAVDANLSAASVSRIRKGLQKPSYDAIKAIVAATGGEVRADTLLGIAA